MHPISMTPDELVRLPLVRNDLTPLELTALTQLQVALDEIDMLTREIEACTCADEPDVEPSNGDDPRG